MTDRDNPLNDGHLAQRHRWPSSVWLPCGNEPGNPRSGAALLRFPRRSPGLRRRALSLVSEDEGGGNDE